ncbi:MAG: BON domain-containing protein [Desulfobacterales bacterium]|nr:BON domain-containing protein [Desulfobacterales bacterium]
MKRLAIIIFCCMLMYGCAGFTWVLSGANIVHDRHYVSSALKDQHISLLAMETISNSPEFVEKSSISVATCNKIVLLTGHTNSWTLWNKARQKVAKISGIRRIYNYVKVKKDAKKIDYLKDTWITTKIRTKIIANFDVDPRKVKVVTDSGTVYLMGCVPRKEANIIVKMARNTDGVKRVKTLFEYIVITQS